MAPLRHEIKIDIKAVKEIGSFLRCSSASLLHDIVDMQKLAKGPLLTIRQDATCTQNPVSAQDESSGPCNITQSSAAAPVAAAGAHNEAEDTRRAAQAAANHLALPVGGMAAPLEPPISPRAPLHANVRDRAISIGITRKR